MEADLLKATPENRIREVDTIVVGGGQAGLTVSYFLSQAGVGHQVLERADRGVGRRLQH